MLFLVAEKDLNRLTSPKIKMLTPRTKKEYTKKAQRLSLGLGIQVILIYI